MFDSSFPEGQALRSVDDAVLVGAITGWMHTAAAADARRLEAIAELERRRCHTDEVRDFWPCDPTDAAAAEISAAMTIGHQRALAELDVAVALRDRLPTVNAVFKTGAVSGYVVSKIVWRTMLITDPAIRAQVDAEIAAKVTHWGPLSIYKIIQAVDLVIAQLDPKAVWQTRTAARNRNVTIGDPDDKDGSVSFWGRLLATDGSMLDKRLTAMATGVCKDDPRTLDQRRADALGALAAGSFQLACTCGSPGCDAATIDDGRASNVTVHVLADPAALHTQPDPMIHGDGRPPAAPAGPQREPAAPPEPQAQPESPKSDSEPKPYVAEVKPSPTPPAIAPSAPPAPAAPPPPSRRATGVIPGGGIVPAPLLAELIRNGATVQFTTPPCTEAEPRYRPSTTLADHVRIRDLTCRYPGCDRPAEFTDIDHTIAWPTGLTHPSNTACLCRKHHLLKTFWTGAGGWAETQLPDGTIVWTTPAGVTYQTHPDCTVLFPTATISAPAPTTRPTPKGVKRPGNDLASFKRKRTRTQDREQRIHTEREHNAAQLAELGLPNF
ncbi:HNH endonuclease signature motif containing protein [soil metagenome]